MSVDTSGISIHSLRVEGDPTHNCSLSHTLDFNPLPPCGGRRTYTDRQTASRYFNPLPPCGGRPHLHVRRETKKIFQSTPSVWRETLLPSQQVLPHSFQSTPSVWRETAPVIHVTCQCRDFNPRPPCGGRRHGSQGRDGRLYTFQSTPSVWRETGHGQQDCRPYPISIHSLRVEGDTLQRIADTLNAISIHSLRVEGDR